MDQTNDQVVHLRYSLRSNLLFITKVIRQHQPLVIPAIFLRGILQAGLPILTIYLTKTVLDFFSLSERVNTDLVGTLAMMILILWLGRTASNALEKWLAMHANRNRHYLLQKIENKVFTMDYVNVEDPVGQRARQRAIRAINSDTSGGEAMIVHFGDLLQHGFGLAFFAAFVALLNVWILLALISASLLSVWLTRLAQLYEARHKSEESVIEQRLNYVRECAVQYESAKDIRLFSMSAWFVDSLRKNTVQIALWKRRILTRYFLVDAAGDLVNFLRDGAAYFYLINQVIHGFLTPGEFTFYFASIAGISNWTSQMSRDLTLLNKASLDIGYLRSYLDIPEHSSVTNAAKVQFSKNVVPEILFENVSYRYPGAAVWTLHDVNLRIRPGEKLSIVGLNGAGKTTLVKLLCGLYQPTEGRILLDHLDISSFNREEYYHLFSVVFQEIRILALDVQQNIALCLKEDMDRARIERVIEQAGLTQTIAALPRQAKTPLTRTLEQDGVLLSGGQAQKLLLARALYKDAPVVILDEPTAALDPLAEAELYQDFSRLVEGKSSIFISHRLASTRFCDRIALLKDGRIHELGSHQELLDLGGEYAHIFEVQARYYRENKEVSDFDKNESKH